ncbi:hypothetical protein VIGAN_03230100, partial [Vigna angularis var. angularis]
VCRSGRIESPESNRINEGPTGGVLLLARVVNQHLHRLALRFEPERNRVPPAARVQRLDRYHSPVRRHRDVNPLLLRARPSHHERDRVVHPLQHLYVLLYRRLIPQPHRIRPLRHHQQHVPLLLPRLYVLHETRYLPFWNRLAASHHHRPFQIRRLRTQLEVPVRHQSCAHRSPESLPSIMEKET